jgi:TolB-like protein
MFFASCASAPQQGQDASAAAKPAAQTTAKAALPETKASKIKVSGRVAIFNFEVKGGGSAYGSLSGDIPESLSESFIKGKLLVPLERRELEKALTEQELALSGLVDDSTAARVGRLAGARYALLGSASIIGDQVRLSCRLIDIETGEILYADSVHGETKSIYSILETLAAQVESGFSS